jgi:hypothetical protein
MMKAASIPETSVNIYQTTRRSNPEDSHLDITDVLRELDLFIAKEAPCGKYKNNRQFGEI